MIHIGTSGWVYASWRRRFYPEHLSQSKWLQYYSSQFDTVELNSTTYRLPRVAQVQAWSEAVPEGFQFTIKLSRLITHRRTFSPRQREYVENFFDRVRSFAPNQVAQILVQFPPYLERQEKYLEEFLATLPPDFRYAIEFRNETWFTPSIRAMLTAHRAALCLHDYPRLKVPLWTTNPDFAYMRLHGYHDLYAGSYPKRALARYIELIASLAREVRDIYVYFNNDTDAAAPKDARRLLDLEQLHLCKLEARPRC